MSLRKQSLALGASKKRGASKIVLGFISMTALLLVSTASTVGAASPPPSGNGYGGGHNNVNINVNVKGDHNIIQIVLHFFFG